LANINKKELLEKEMGFRIEKAKIYCPLCSDGEQPMSTVGDFENELFCPHCNFSFEIKINIHSNRHFDEYLNDWYSRRKEK